MCVQIWGANLDARENLTEEVTFGLRPEGPQQLFWGTGSREKARVKKSVLVCETETPAWLWLDLKCGRQ